MEAKLYPIEKRRILIERSQANFVAFLQQVTDPQGRNFVRNQLLQRRVPGFREGRAPLKRTVPQLIHTLKQEQELTNPDSAIWDLFTKAWMYWVKSHPELDDVLTTFDNGADFDDNHQCIRPPNSELDVEGFRVLLEASHKSQIDQETIRDFYEYGYFKTDADIENLIDQALPRQKIEQKQQIEQLPDQVDSIRREVDELRSQISDLKVVNELEQILDQQIANAQQSFENQISELSHQISEVRQYLENQISESNFTQTISLLRQSITALETRITEFINAIDRQITPVAQEIRDANQFVEDRLETVHNDISEIQSTVEKQNQFTQLAQQIRETNQSVEDRLEAVDRDISKIQSTLEEQNQSAVPRIAHRASEIGENYRSNLNESTERYTDENEYLDDFYHGLRRFGVTGSEDEEMAAAIHIALKAFPAVEIADARIIKVWRLMCDNHFYDTTINVEMGWLGLQDWFPNLFARQCFGEQLEPVELESSIRRMLEFGNMLWVIYFRYCDRSFPDTYLPGFLDWISGSCHNGIRTLLIRCSGTNRCETNEGFYERIARLPKPKSQEPIESRNLRPSRIPLTLLEWHAWCQPDPNIDSQYERPYDFLEELRSVIENSGMQIPIEILREIRRYLQLSYEIMAPTRALDWALTLRLLPWIGNRHRLIDIVQNLVDNQKSPHFQEGLQIAREAEA